MVIIMQSITLLSIASFVAYQWRYRFDARRVADVMAANLIDEYQDGIYQLSENGIADYARKKYLELSFAVGLPSGLADMVADRVADNVAKVQVGAEQSLTVEPIYE